MAINKRMEDALNEQINAELYSAYLYLSMATWFESKNLSGFAHWMRGQYLEETMHGMKMFNFLNERGGRILLKPIKGPDTKWESFVEVFEQVLNHEMMVTGLINKLIKLSREIDDYASESFLMWFVDEQVEEESTADEILSRLKLIGNDTTALINFDNELKTRQPTALALAAIMDQPAV
ncbi:MAG: ferritin [Spirochaetaceae bacterium]|jgi:ferritin|nr:ferritin [Spirochaetaceae bacterium]